jgi:hypothetical protein
MSGPFGSTAWMANLASGFYDHTIDQSCRFEAGDNPYLSKTYGSAGSSVDVWTVSWWMKLTNGSAKMRVIFGGGGTFSGGSNTATFISLGGSGVIPSVILQQYNSGTRVNVMATPLLRDESAWYHCVVRFDSTQSTDTNRVRIYINGVESPAYTRYDGSTVLYPNQNVDSTIGGATEHYIAKAYGTANSDGCFYLADFNYCDGQSLAPSSFGEFKNDIWIAKDTSGLTFGDNGFRMQFETSGTLGNDTSGNNNDYASSGLAATDQVPDSPTNNFATINPLSNPPTITSGNTFSEGNLKLAFSTAAGTFPSVLGTIPMVTGKWYWEISYDYASQINAGFGVYNQTTSLTTDYGAAQGGLDDAGLALFKTSTILKLFLDTKTTIHSSSFADPIIIGVMFDADNGKLYLKFANAELAGQTISNGTTIFDTFTTGKLYMPAIYHGDGGSGTKTGTIYANFGQDSSFSGSQTAQGNADANGKGDFYYAPPSGFLALCTANLPDPVATIDPNEGGSPQDYFNTVLYTGNAGTQNITGVGFQPDWVWLKPRSYADNNVVFDSVRGVNQTLYVNTDGAESDRTGNDSLTAFGSDGFSIGDWNNINTNSGTLVSWNWKAGTSFSNDASSTSVGTIDSTGSVSADTGFSIISYTGTGSNATVAHGLNSAPDVVLVKGRSNNPRFWTYWGTQFDANTTYIYLNTNDDEDTGGATVTNSAYPTSTVFSIGTSTFVNGSSETYIAYCFHEVDGYSKFGTYTGNDNASGPFVYTGFRPAFVMIKDKTVAGNWVMYDNKRDPYNFAYKAIFANTSGAEQTNTALGNIDFLSNGFKLRDNSNDSHAGQVSGATPIYMAFAEQPFKYANAR